MLVRDFDLFLPDKSSDKTILCQELTILNRKVEVLLNLFVIFE